MNLWVQDLLQGAMLGTPPFSHSKAFKLSANQLKKQMRRHFRHKRQQLNSTQLQNASNQLCRLIQAAYFLKRSCKIGFYVAMGGEIDPLPLIQKVSKAGKSVYLPTLHPLKHHHLVFIEVNSRTKLIKNKYGILEPYLDHSLISPNYELDVVLCPLVAFDRQGHRLGMGGGYYDRSFHFKKKGHRPILVGLAHDFQEHPSIPHNSRDIPLDVIVTPTQVITMSRSGTIKK